MDSQCSEHGNEGGGCDDCLLTYESSSTRIYRLNDPENAFGGRTGAVAVKVLASERPDPEQVSRLCDEYILSRGRLLSECASIRASLKHSKYDGMPAIYLEWVDGVTLRQWVPSVVQGARAASAFDDARRALLDITYVAWIISGELSAIHEAGVVHNNISIDNIIVDASCSGKGFKEGCIDEGSDRDRFSVKIIDLGDAALLNQNDDPGSTGTRNDIFSLGVVLYYMFSGQEPLDQLGYDNSDSWDLSERSDVAPTSSPPPIDEIEKGPIVSVMPRSVVSIVSKLNRGGSAFDECSYYTSAREVQRDLFQILDYPDRFLFHLDPKRITPELEFPSNRLYGRAEETFQLLDACMRAVTSGARPGVVLVSGVSGSGKTALVEQAREPISSRGGYFVTGKFSSHQPVEPLSAIIAAFTDYCAQCVARNDGTIDKIAAAILEQVGPTNVSFLVGLIPSLQHVLRAEPIVTATVKVGGPEAQNRLYHSFKVLARTIASPSHPLVIFLDDLQWADAESLSVIKTLITDTESKSLLLIGCYRDNEVDSSKKIDELLLNHIDRRDVNVTKIKVDNISLDALNHMVSDTLYALRSSTKALAEVVHLKTKGNAFFAIEFLKSLYDEGLLYFSYSTGSWQWDVPGIQEKNVADTSVELVTNKILRLPAGARSALEVAACLGSPCDESILSLVINDDDLIDVRILPGVFVEGHGDSLKAQNQLSMMLDVVVGQGLMEKVGGTYAFAHDQIQQAAYNLMPENTRRELHARIGRRLWKKCPAQKFEDVIFLAANQLRRGSAFVDQGDKIELARLYLLAGRKAMSSSFFLPAALYLKEGIGVLEPGHWEDQYDLSLKLAHIYAECEYCNGNMDESKQMLDQIFSHARCFEDKLSGYFTLVKALGAIDELQEAIEIGFLALEKLGERFPDEDNAPLHIFREWKNTREMLDGYTDETLLMIQVMKDKGKLAAMGFLKWLAVYTYLVKQKYLPLIIMRMMQLSLQYGLCHESAPAFAAYGLISIKSFGDVTRGFQFGQISLHLVERFVSKDCLARVYAVVYGCINHWKEHIGQSIEPLLNGYHIGMAFGDIQYAMTNAYRYCICSFQCGRQIAQLEDELGVFCEQMRAYNQDRRLSLALVTRQMLQNLMGRSVNPVCLNGDAMNQDEMLKIAISKKNSYLVCYIYLHRMWLAYLYGNYELAAEMAEKSCNVEQVDYTVFAVCNHAFFYGLTSLALARKTKDEKWGIIAREKLQKMKCWSADAPVNFQHKVALLEAELAFLEQDFSDAEKLYDIAIDLAGENGFLREKAIACEIFAIFCVENGDTSRSSDLFEKAIDLYLEWGARSKANHLRCQILSLFRG